MDANYTNWRSQEKEYFRNIYQSISTQLVAEYYNIPIYTVRKIANHFKIKKENIPNFQDSKQGGRLVKLYVNDILQHSAFVSKKRTLEVVNTWLKLYPKNKYIIYYTITI